MNQSPSSPTTNPTNSGPSRLTTLTAEEMAMILERAGAGVVTADDIKTTTGQGAPINPDGTFHFVHYTAWLVQQVCRRF